MANIYIFFGKAGSGKGTQAQELKKHLENLGKKVIYIETGGFFREMIKSGSFAGKRTQEIIDQGHLMPPSFPVYAWTDRLVKEFTGIEEVIMDGAGRHMEEAKMLEGTLDFFQFENRFIIPIELSDESAMSRLMIRNQGRPDDASKENIQKRLDWYQSDVIPVINFFTDNPKYKKCSIDGEVTVPEVFEQIKKVIQV